MYDSSLREEVDKSFEVLQRKRFELESSGIPFPTANYDLVLDIVETDDKKISHRYYYVNHNTKTLFWLELYDMTDLLSDILGVTEPGQISK